MCGKATPGSKGRATGLGALSVYELMENETCNQHFLPRVEQKLNALNPQAKARNLRIYSFRLVDRETYSLALESPNGRSIDGNLSLFDLFSFDVSAPIEEAAAEGLRIFDAAEPLRKLGLIF